MKYPQIWRKLWLLSSALIVLTSGIWLWQIDRDLQRRLGHGWFLPPVEFYSAPRTLKAGQKLDVGRLEKLFQIWEWRRRLKEVPLHGGDYKILPAPECSSVIPRTPWLSTFDTCLSFAGPAGGPPVWLLSDRGTLAKIYDESGKELEKAELPAELVAQYYDGQPILRDVIDLGRVPLACSQAVTAIEDAEFLEHKGISPTGIFRALGRNLIHGRFAEGASTITQQLVKNYFLTSEKTIRRKLTEQAMAVLLELRVDKDEILANYLNEIYMGQKGSFQVRGFAAASKYYFGKEIQNLELPECALLAAIVNNPGRYNPFFHPDRARQRRTLVLRRMLELRMIGEAENAGADRADLAVKPSAGLSEPAPYFVQEAWEQVLASNVDSSEGLKIYTTLVPEIQEKVQVAAPKHLAELEKQRPKLKSPGLNPIQGAVIVVDVESGGISALVGGRQYKLNQFNRIRSAKRQPGSLFKPIVYLAALESGDYNPKTELRDEPWSLKYEGQEWTPRNFERNFRGNVTMTDALAHSLNVPTARLAMTLGIPTVVELARRLGIVSELPRLPSVSLGAAEVTPLEIAQAYLTIARRGKKIPLHMIDRITDGHGKEILRTELPVETVVREDVADPLIEMMRETFRSGTAQAAKAWGLPDEPSGKTGTTSDTKDAWFAGFNATTLAVAWVGFDDNRPTGLTGAAGALPLWYHVMY